ncbi:lactaldehyde reductase [Aspergillus udagawae]|uniref:Lactaldehyde reductase n=1 Tax=Aspergillus udagawae TaxID=91492 RepID=A0A8H3S2X1_9EURO|nr:lactaldehyde reductase [Aspergillus udagawae]
MPETVRPAFADRPRPLLSYGIPFPAAAAHHVVDTFGASKIYIICSGSLARNTDALDRLTTALGPEKVVGRRIGMQSHTLWSEVLEIVHDARRVEADLLLTLGAGSLTDGAKVAALALANNVQTASDLATLATGPDQRVDIHAPTIPIISIPTSLSAAEYSNFAGATDDTTRRKHSFQAPTRGPQLVILDPDLATTTPPAIWLSTGIRAVDHCVETLCATSGTTESTDAHATHALELLVPGLLRCRHDRADRDARLQCQLGAVNAMAALTGGSVELGASHGIGHQLGPLGVGHGETSCILLPAVCKFNARHGANREQQERVGQFLVRNAEVARVLRDRGVDVSSADLGDVLDAVIRELGMPRSLKEVGVGRDALNELAANSLHDRWCRTNPVPLTEKRQVLEILEMVVE